MKEKTVVGLGWWQAKQWKRLKEISEDRDNLEDTYEEWRKNASGVIRELEAQGQIIKKISINLEDLMIWSNENNLPVNGASRANYSGYILGLREH